jgi:MFS family permease
LISFSFTREVKLTFLSRNIKYILTRSSGRAFTVFHWCFDFGTVAGPTISALIAAHTNWTYTYKWTAGLIGAAIIPVFFFLEETSWGREEGAVNIPPPVNFFAGRIATFFPGNRVTPKTTLTQTV